MEGKLNKVDFNQLNAKDEISVSKMSKNDIAIIGIAAEMPMANSVEEFWKNIESGKDCVRPIPVERQNHINSYLTFINQNNNSIDIEEQGYLDEIDKFDYGFFNLSPNEAKVMDPNHRMFLQTAWHTIEDAGYSGDRIRGTKTGVYVGFSRSLRDNYERLIYEVNPNVANGSATANIPSILASRISYILDLKGPALVIDTACSSSLVAVHLACQGLKTGNCEMAIAGGVKLSLLPLRNISEKVGIESPDYRTRSFDDSANGAGAGEGCVAMLLKPLEKALRDRDNIYATIKGTAINQDGSSLGITAPNSLAQAEVMVAAWKDARINPEEISYIEAHGTATKLGDPVEIEGISEAFRRYTNRKQFCAIGSVKSNIGHLDTTSGIAGMLKAIMALKHKRIPPTIHFIRPNRNINFHLSPVYINETIQDWNTEHHTRLCGISSFALSGTNCHVVLEEASSQIIVEKRMPLQVLTISAKTKDSLRCLIDSYSLFVNSNENANLQNICYTANTGREHYSHRIAIIIENIEDLKIKLSLLKKSELKENVPKDIFYGKVYTNELKVEKNNFEKKLSVSCKELLMDSSGKRNDILHEMCLLYVKGMFSDWNAVYKELGCCKISLPLYPFAKEKCWIDFPLTSNVINLKKPHANENNIGGENKFVTNISLEGRADGAYTIAEKKIARIWCEILGFEMININHNYYDLGGDSIKGITIINQINKQFSVNIATVEFYKHLTVKDLSQYLENEALNSNDYIVLKRSNLKKYYQTSSAQKRIFMLNKNHLDIYNFFNAFIILGQLDMERLKKALEKLVHIHSVLRTSFQEIGGNIMQIVHETMDFNLEEETIKEAIVQVDIEEIIKKFIRPYDLENSPLFRVKIIRFSEEKHLMIFEIHQIISDRLSMMIFENDFQKLYTNNCLEETKFQYIDFSEWKNKLMKTDYIKLQLDYWKNIYMGSIPTAKLPTDYIRSSNRNFKTASHVLKIDRCLTNALKELASKNGATLDMILLAVYYILLNKYSGLEDIVIGFPVTGRPYNELQNVMGPFANILAIRTFPSSNKLFLHFLNEVKVSALSAFANQDCEVDDLVKCLAVEPSKAGNPLFDVIFIMHIFDSMDIGTENLKFESCEFSNRISEYDLILNVSERKDGEGINISWDYGIELYKIETILSLAESYIGILKEIVNDPSKALSDLKVIKNKYI
ncbi:condensation domain-containing protein [Lacrimispora algidixylanolytica]|uniref:Uncharacterized protein n=1 Tax=Lacrimispora algidixylanolytica TaxID=94868 RepID=A0A419T1J9_9FIRM|nr:condensation domain-containing protein [Lacrimispora algidixylanolytica]RKD31345.1 hypothetical protein BET01_20730 [Lacrimispora algidixylanolytica]